MFHDLSVRWQEDLFWDFQDKQLCTGPWPPDLWPRGVPPVQQAQPLVCPKLWGVLGPGETGSGQYPISCKHELNSFFQRVVAIRNIEKGTELTICYLGEKNRFTGVEKRRKILRNYGFVCSCDTCKIEENLKEDPCYLKDYMKLESLIDSQNMLGSIFLEKEKILERNCSKIIWRILNFKNAIIHYANVDPSSLEYELIFDKLRRLEELVKIQRSLWQMMYFQ